MQFQSIRPPDHGPMLLRRSFVKMINLLKYTKSSRTRMAQSDVDSEPNRSFFARVFFRVDENWEISKTFDRK
jgi:hypothetical protein